MSASLHASVVLHGDVELQAVCHTYTPPVLEATTRTRRHVDGTTTRICSLYIGKLTLQGTPEEMVAFLDRARSLVAAEIGRTWPVETAHAEPAEVRA